MARTARAAVGLACVGVASVLALPLSAQSAEGTSIFTLLSPAGSLEIGSETTGTLTPADFLSEGRRVQAYTLEGPTGGRVTIDLISDDFDAYLYLIGPDGNEIGSDDDSGGACHARLSMVLPLEGTYTIVVGAWGSATGAFRVRAGDRERSPAAERCDGSAIEEEMLQLFTGLEPSGELTLGDEVTGSLARGDPQLGDGSLLDAYRLAGTPGQTVVIDLVSRSFDALLYVVDPSGEDFASDDDGGGACNSRIEITLGTEPHLIVVNSIDPTGTGEYTVRVSGEWGRESDGSCPGG